MSKKKADDGLIIIAMVGLAICFAMLLGAESRHRYAYYEELRWIVAATWALTAWHFYRYGWPIVTALCALVVLLYNPIAPIHMHRFEWQPYDAGTAVASLAAIGMLWYKRRASNKAGSAMVSK